MCLCVRDRYSLSNAVEHVSAVVRENEGNAGVCSADLKREEEEEVMVVEEEENEENEEDEEEQAMLETQTASRCQPFRPRKCR